MKMRKICIFLLVSMLIFSLSGCSKIDNSPEALEEKVNAEIEYLDTEIITMMSDLNNINFSNYLVKAREVEQLAKASEKTSGSSQGSSQGGGSSGASGQSGGGQQGGGSDSQNGQNVSQSETSTGAGNGSGQGESGGENAEKIKVTEMVAQSSLDTNYDEVDWEEIKTSVETFYTSWNTIILDLYKLNVNSEDITGFSGNLDQLVINIKNQDKPAALASATTLYSYIPKYLDSFSQDSALKDLTTAKMHIMNAYTSATLDAWDVVAGELLLAEQAYTNVMKNTEYMSQKEYNVNKTYITFKELQNAVQYQDKTVFFLKYKNLMQEIDVM